MHRKKIAVNDFKIPPIKLWADQWLMLTAGDYNKNSYNFMTVAWGGFIVMWAKPTVMVVVRPSRHTFGYIEKYDSFTLSAFAPEYRDKLLLCGTKSGRDFDKIKSSGLTPEPAKSIECPVFKEAELIVECKKIYAEDFNPAKFISPDIEKQYNGGDYHKMFFGEILNIEANEKYL